MNRRSRSSRGPSNAASRFAFLRAIFARWRRFPVDSPWKQLENDFQFWKKSGAHPADSAWIPTRRAGDPAPDADQNNGVTGLPAPDSAVPAAEGNGAATSGWRPTSRIGPRLAAAPMASGRAIRPLRGRSAPRDGTAGRKGLLRRSAPATSGRGCHHHRFSMARESHGRRTWPAASGTGRSWKQRCIRGDDAGKRRDRPGGFCNPSWIPPREWRRARGAGGPRAGQAGRGAGPERTRHSCFQPPGRTPGSRAPCAPATQGAGPAAEHGVPRRQGTWRIRGLRPELRDRARSVSHLRGDGRSAQLERGGRKPAPMGARTGPGLCHQMRAVDEQAVWRETRGAGQPLRGDARKGGSPQAASLARAEGGPARITGGPSGGR